MNHALRKILHYENTGIGFTFSIGFIHIKHICKKTLLNEFAFLEKENAGLKTEKQMLDRQLKESTEKCEELDAYLERQEKTLKGKEIQLQEQQTIYTELEKNTESQKEQIRRLEETIENHKRYAEQQEKKLEEQQAHLSSYKEGLWCTGWIEYWKQYYIENHEKITEKIDTIKRGTDHESQDVIDVHLERNFNIFSVQKYADYFLYDKNKIFLPWEVEGENQGLPESEIREKYNLPQDIYLETPVFKFHCGLVFLPEKILHQIDGCDVIDGGAFWGDSALVLQEYSPKSIHAFEPLKQSFDQLCATKEKNHMEILFPVQMGLGDRESDSKLYYHEMMSGASVVRYKAIINEKPELHEDEIMVTTIDKYVEEKGIDVGLIKLDIEGNELEAVRGARNTICKYRPILLISVYHLPKDLFGIKPFLESLNLSYKFMFRKLVFHDPLTEVVLIGYVEKTDIT